MDDAGFYQRMVGSARGLACSTFSGVIGIEAELRDPRAPGKQQIVRSARNLETVSAGNDHRRNDNTREEESASFRSSRHVGGHDESQREFDVFSEHSPSLKEALFDDRASESGHTAVSGQHVYLRPETWHLAIDENEMMLGSDQRHDVPAQAMERVVVVARTNAALRLDQVQQHISTAAVRLNQRQAAVESQGQNTSRREDMFTILTIPLHPPTNNRRLIHVRQIPQKTEDRMDEGQDEDGIHGFHCPFIGCHDNVASPRLEYLLETYGMICVHVDCDFTFEDKRDWLAHIVTSHHDIQAAVVGDDSHVPNDCDCQREHARAGGSRSTLCAYCCSYDLERKYAELQI